MRVLWPRRYPLIRYATIVLMLCATALVTTIALSIEEDSLGDLWSMENRPHPWPWPGQEKWMPVRWSSERTFDFGPVFARTAVDRQVVLMGEPLRNLQDICHAVLVVEEPR